jgi:heme/copper-type cytochrome/quinol oxidase subunit 1
VAALCAKIRLMRWIDALSKSQRLVVVIAFGLALGTLGSYLVSLGSGPVASGWYAYSPLTTGPFLPQTGLHPWLRVIIWLVLIGVWAVGSVRVLRPSSGDVGGRP